MPLELVPFATVVLGPPCSSFVFLSRGTSKRYAWNKFMGDQSRQDVRDANEIVSRFVTILKILLLRLVQYIVEQPLTSCLFRLAAWRRFARLEPVITLPNGVVLRRKRKFVWLGHWGIVSLNRQCCWAAPARSRSSTANILARNPTVPKP